MESKNNKTPLWLIDSYCFTKDIRDQYRNTSLSTRNNIDNNVWFNTMHQREYKHTTAKRIETASKNEAKSVEEQFCSATWR